MFVPIWILLTALVLDQPAVEAETAAVRAWVGCLYEHAQRAAELRDTSDVVANGAIAACRGEEDVFELRKEETLSPLWGIPRAREMASTYVAEQRERHRARLIAFVQDMRTGR